jgi:hypothetical protein
LSPQTREHAALPRDPRMSTSRRSPEDERNTGQFVWLAQGLVVVLHAPRHEAGAAVGVRWARMGRKAVTSDSGSRGPGAAGLHLHLRLRGPNLRFWSSSKQRDEILQMALF